jgi:DNA invertase Pin-like site-specific DNA recombinase
MCREFGERQGWTLAGTYTDRESGATFERAGLAQVFAALESRQAGILVVSRVDRLARDPRVFADTFERVYELGGKVAIVHEGRVFDTPLALAAATVFHRAVAENERLTIRERTEAALRQRIKAGGWIGAAVYGYELMRRADGAKEPVPHNEQAQVVQRIFSRILVGDTVRNIAKELTDEGVRTGRHGVAWHNSAVRNIVARGELYAGEPFERKWTVGGVQHVLTFRYPALIARADVDKARRLVATRTRKPENESPFRGLVTCSRCGSVGAATSAKWEQYYSERVHFYTCRSASRARYRRGMGLAHQGDYCPHSVIHLTIKSAVLRYLSELDPETGASAFHLETVRVSELLAQRRRELSDLEL